MQLKFFQSMKNKTKCDLPDSVIEWQWLIWSEANFQHEKLSDEMKHPIFYPVKIELTFTPITSKCVVQNLIWAVFPSEHLYCCDNGLHGRIWLTTLVTKVIRGQFSLPKLCNHQFTQSCTLPEFSIIKQFDKLALFIEVR